MGALDTLQNFVKKKISKKIKKEVTNAFNAATPGRGDTSKGTFGGFPFINYASERITLRPMMVPRQKYTYGVEFHINEDALLDGVAITNISKFVTNGNLYTQLKRIDHPKPGFAVETLRSYNKYVKLPTRMEYPPASMTFDDDNTSITAALIKEYINFYSHAGDVGTQLISAGNTSDAGPVRPPNFNSSFADSSFSLDDPNVGYNHLISNSATDQPRAFMNTRPSLGLRLKPNYKRHFFDSIVIYDLGTEPNSVNIYYFYKPVITTIDHAGLDTEDRTSKVEITINFEYENYYFAVGRNRVEVADAVELLTGIRPPDDITQNFFPNYHGAMKDKPDSTVVPVSKASANPMTPMPDTDSKPSIRGVDNLPVDPFGEPKEARPPGEVQAEIDTVRGDLADLASATSSTGGDDAETEFETARLTNKLKLLNAELNASAGAASAAQKVEQAAPATQSAVENTVKKEVSGIVDKTAELIDEIENDDSLTDEQKRNIIGRIEELGIAGVRRLANTLRRNNALPVIKNASNGNWEGQNKRQWERVEKAAKSEFDKNNARIDAIEEEIQAIETENPTDTAGFKTRGARRDLAGLLEEIRVLSKNNNRAVNRIAKAQIGQDQIKAWENAELANEPV